MLENVDDCPSCGRPIVIDLPCPHCGHEFEGGDF